MADAAPDESSDAAIPFPVEAPKKRKRKPNVGKSGGKKDSGQNSTFAGKGGSKSKKAGTKKTSAPDAGGWSIPGLDSFPFKGASIQWWQKLDEKVRRICYDKIAVYFQNLLDDFLANANGSVKLYRSAAQRQTVSRVILIVATGGLAVLNVLAASRQGSTTQILSLSAAVYAALLALLTNLESFFNFSEKKVTSRESRELYLDAFRQFETLRLTCVYPFGYSAEACFNYCELYKRLIVKDIELRRKIMQLNAARPGAAAEKEI